MRSRRPIVVVEVAAAEVVAEEAEEEAMGPAEYVCALSVNSPATILIAVLRMLPRK